MVSELDFCSTLESVFFDFAKISVKALNERCLNTLNSALEIEFVEIGENHLSATMPVNQNTVQPMRMLNGGASLALIECVGSMAANLALDRDKFVAVGQSVFANHYKPALEGDIVTGRANPVHIGKRSQIWEVLIVNSKGVSVCKGSITMAVLSKENTGG